MQKLVLALGLVAMARLPALALPPSPPAAAATRAEVLVLGTYHMANPGQTSST